MADLAHAIAPLLAAATWEETADAVDAHPELLEGESLATLRLMVGSDDRLDELDRATLEDLSGRLAECARAGDSASLRNADVLHWTAVRSRFADTVADGLATHERFRASGDLGELDRSERAWLAVQDDLEFLRTPVAFQLLVLDGIGAAHLARYYATGDPDALDAGLQVVQAAVDRTPADAYLRGRRLTNLSGGLLARAQRRDGPDDAARDLHAGVEAAREAVDLTAPDDPLWPGRVNNLVAATIAEAEQDPARLDDSSDVLDRAVAAAPASSAALPRLLHARATIAKLRYQRDDDLDDLAAWVAAAGEAVARANPEHTDLPLFLGELALALGVRYEEHGDVSDLDRAVDTVTRAVEAGRGRHPAAVDHLTTYGMLLRTRYDGTGDLDDLASAVAAYRAAWQASRDGAALQRYGNSLEQHHAALTAALDTAPVERRADLLRRIGHVDLDLYAIADDPILLERAIDGFTAAVEAATGTDERAESLTRLALAVRTRAAGSRSRGDLDEVVDLTREVVALAGDHQAYSNLGLALTDRYRVTGNLDDLAEAIGFLRLAADGVAPDDPDVAGVISNLTVALLEHAERTGERASLDEGIDRGLAATRTLPRDSPPWLTLAAATAEALGRRYAATGDPTDVDRALELCWDATDQARARSRAHAGVYNALGGALRARFARSADPEDLQQAVTALRLAVDSDPQAGYLGNLGSVLRLRFVIVGDRDDLDDAIGFLETSVELADGDGSEQAMSQMNLGVGLLERFNVDADADDLTVAVERLRDASAHPLATPPVVAASRVNLGNALLNRYERGGHAADLDEALTVLTQPGVDASPRASVMLGRVLRERYERDGDEADLTAGRLHLEDGARRGLDTDVEAGLSAASVWAEWALERGAWAEACEAADLAVAASERVLAVALDMGRKQRWLRLAGDVPALAAYALARVGRVDEAREAIEHGRARLLSEALELDRTDLERLPELGHAELHHRFREASRRLQESLLDDHADPSLRARSLSAESRRAIREHFDAVVAEIRTIPGYGGLLQRLTPEQVAQACATAPLVYVLTTPAGGLALAVTDGPRGVHVEPIWLDGIDDAVLRARLLGDGEPGYLDAQLRHRSAPDDPTARQRWLDTLDRTTGWLWDAVMGPLIDGLTTSDIGLDAGVVLVPSGLLGLLPLHAAWTNAPDGRRYAIDVMALRYAPNARAVVVAQERTRRLGSERLLLAVDPRPTTGAALPAAPEEAVQVLAHWGQQDRTVRWHEDVTLDAIAPLLDEHSVFHFAGHASADWSEPTHGGLLLAHDEVLTVDRLARDRVTLRLAVLSACETGLPGARMPNEVIGLPTALVQAGACGVIASLWSVPDDSTRRLMDRLYRLWREDGYTAAEALRLAQASMRADGLAHPHHWAAFTYTGV